MGWERMGVMIDEVFKKTKMTHIYKMIIGDGKEDKICNSVPNRLSV